MLKRNYLKKGKYFANHKTWNSCTVIYYPNIFPISLRDCKQNSMATGAIFLNSQNFLLLFFLLKYIQKFSLLQRTLGFELTVFSSWNTHFYTPKYLIKLFISYLLQMLYKCDRLNDNPQCCLNLDLQDSYTLLHMKIVC